MAKAVKVGIFLVVGIVLFCVGLFLIGSRAQLFGNHFVVYADFNNVNTLQTGAMVRVSGLDAGQVTEIEIPKSPSAQFRLKLKIDQKFRPIIRKDSKATIESNGFVGNMFVNVTKGSANSPECPIGCTLSSQEPVSMSQLMKEGSALAQNLKSTVTDVRQRADTAIDNVASTAAHANKLLVALSPNVEKVASNASAITTDIRHGHGAAGKLLTDRTVGSNVGKTVANLEKASQNANTILSDVQHKDLGKIHQTVENAESATKQLNKAVGTFLAPGKNNENTAMALHDTVQNANQAMGNLAGDTEAIKTNFFFRGFFNRRGFYNLSTLTPNKYNATRFVKKPRERVWIAGNELFTVGPDGSQELTANGRRVLDRSMSKLTPYLPNNPIMVEGYSTTGLPDQQYLAARERALEVRQYLLSRFHLKSRWIGIMPLGDHPPAKTGKKSWDGVCLVLVVSEKR